MSTDVFGDEILTDNTSVDNTSVDNTNIESNVGSNELGDNIDNSDSYDNIDADNTSVDNDNESEEVINDTRVNDTSVDNEDNASRNFAAIRQSKRELEARLKEQARELQELKNAKERLEKAATQDNDFDIDNDIAPQESNVANNAINKQRQQMQQMYAQTQALQAEIRIKQKYNDFEEVVSVDNVDILKALYPKVAYKIIQETDFTKKAEKAYEAMKKYKIFTTDAKIENRKARVSKNISKPRPLSSVKSGSPALGAANAFAEDSAEERRRLYEEMKRFAKG